MKEAYTEKDRENQNEINDDMLDKDNSEILKENKVKKFLSDYTKFFEVGKMGSIVLCGFLTALFLFGMFPQSIHDIFSSPLVFLFSVTVSVLGTEIVYLLVRIILGNINRERIYFLVAFAVVSACAIFATQVVHPIAGIVIGFLVTFFVSLFGCLIFRICVKKHTKGLIGYFLMGFSFLGIVLFGIFFYRNGFGEKEFINYYSMGLISKDKKEADTNDAISGFSDYMGNGSYKVKTIDYGQNGAIKTTTTDLSQYAKRDGILAKIYDKIYYDYTLKETPIKGRIWYPEGERDCPVLFIAHGNHAITVDSYLGYDYLGEYLASNGYVVVSVDENSLNELSGENDGRAILLLENIKTILNENKKKDSLIYEFIDENKIAIAGHSRGGEMVSLAYEFNDLKVYPDNGNIHFDYHFPISGVIAISPSVDQYMPADHAVKLTDVNYLLLHGANDQDVTSMMGEKQYHNVTFSGSGDYRKASVYILGANHGQFNSTWGAYDLGGGYQVFLNTNNLLTENEQQQIAKVYIRTFLDAVLLENETYADLLTDVSSYQDYLPKTVLQTNFSSSDFISLNSFDKGGDITKGASENISIQCTDVTNWQEQVDTYGFGGDGENYVLYLSWDEKSKNPRVKINIPSLDISENDISFRIADMREEKELSLLDYQITLYDNENRQAYVKKPCVIYPSFALQLYKSDFFTNTYEYKHQLQTVMIPYDRYQKEKGFNEREVCRIEISFPSGKKGKLIIDDIGITQHK
ncbi:MAG: hypothetical protein ACI4F4_02110 [Lachnospiraceae bacterium]